jgi:hypothetical protein
MRPRPGQTAHNHTRPKNWREPKASNAGRRGMIRSARRALKRAGCTCDPDLSNLSDAELLDIAACHRWVGLHHPWCRLG